MELYEILISSGITVFAIGLSLLTLLSYKKHHSPKLMVISMVFLIFLAKGILLSVSLFYPQIAWLQTLLFSTVSGVFDLLILLLLFIATLKK